MKCRKNKIVLRDCDLTLDPHIVLTDITQQVTAKSSTRIISAKSNQIKSNRIKSNQIKSNRIKSNRIKLSSRTLNLSPNLRMNSDHCRSDGRKHTPCFP